MYRLKEHPFINDDWLAKNEDQLQAAIWEEGWEEFSGFGLKHFVAGVEEEEYDFLRAYELRSERMCYDFGAHKQYDAYYPIPKWLESRLKDEGVFNVQITNENIENFNQAIRDTANDVAWGLADAWQEFLGVKPSWAHDTIKEDWAKLDPPKEIWWEEEPHTDTETRILYQRLSEPQYPDAEVTNGELWDRIETHGHTLRASANMNICYEFDTDGEEYCGDKDDAGEYKESYQYEYSLNP